MIKAVDFITSPQGGCAASNEIAGVQGPSGAGDARGARCHVGQPGMAVGGGGWTHRGAVERRHLRVKLHQLLFPNMFRLFVQMEMYEHIDPGNDHVNSILHHFSCLGLVHGFALTMRRWKPSTLIPSRYPGWWMAPPRGMPFGRRWPWLWQRSRWGSEAVDGSSYAFLSRDVSGKASIDSFSRWMLLDGYTGWTWMDLGSSLDVDLSGFGFY